MKIRNGFVSNSSSSSFVIKLDDISARQLQQIQNHIEVAKSMGVGDYYESPWDIEVMDDVVRGDTWMDNFDMHEFLNAIGVKDDDIEWD